MKNKSIIPYAKFVEAFEKVGWKQANSGDGRYNIFTDPSNADVWTRVPINESDADYATYVDRNILFLLYALDLPEDEESILDLKSQLKNYNYKLLNRIVTKTDHSNAIPFELANMLPEKNISAFRFFYHTHAKTKQKTIPIEKFELNHTEIGSFVIPVSIKVEDDSNRFVAVQNDMNILLHKYLSAVDKMSHVPRSSAAEFADRIMADDIDSRLVKDFFGADNSIARYREKYKESVATISIGSRGSALLDFKLPQNEQKFPEVDLGSLVPIKEEFLEVLEEREIQADRSTMDMHDIQIKVLVNGLNDKGRAQFTVVSIGGTDVKKPFKASSVRLAKAKLDTFASKFINGESITIVGDIEKRKGRMGEILIDRLASNSDESTDEPEDDRVSMFPK